MAIGTVTVVEKLSAAFHNLSIVEVSFAGDSAYAPGGTATFSKLTDIFAALGGKRIVGILEQGGNGGYVCKYDAANDKLMVYEGNYDASDGPMQESSTSNLSGVTFKLALLCV